MQLLAPGQKPTAAMMGLASAGLLGNVFSKDFTSAPRAFSVQLVANENSMQAALLDKSPENTITAIITVSSPEALGAIVGMPTIPESIHCAIVKHGPELTKLNFKNTLSFLETVAELNRELAGRWLASDSSDGLLYRTQNEIPWSTATNINVQVGIAVASYNHVHTADEFVTDTHGEVVALCRYLFALAPQTDRADVEACDATGRAAEPCIYGR